MNTDTGKLYAESALSKQDLNSGKFAEIENKDMTKEQKRTRQVRMNDNETKLGKKFTEIRKSKIVHKGDPCPCGSGKIFKYCCQHVKKTQRS